MPKINFDTPICDLKGEPVMNDGKPVVLEDLAANALLIPDQQMTGKKKVECFNLALKVKGEVELSVEEVSSVKEAISKAYPPLYVGRAWEILDPSA